MEELLQEGFTRLELKNTDNFTSCIYAMIYSNEVVYIGQSTDFKSRLRQWKNKPKFNVDDIYIKEEEPVNLNSVESFYITLFKPIYNTAGIVKDIGTTKFKFIRLSVRDAISKIKVRDNISNYKLAKVLGIKQQIMITRYLAGEVKSVNTKVAWAIYSQYGILVDSFNTVEELKACYETLSTSD